MAMNALSPVEDAFTGPVGLITERMGAAMQTMRANHPVSILDISAAYEPALELGRWVRRLNRKVRLMSYDWMDRKAREHFVGSPEVLVEKGAFPGLHFSAASFDFVVGVDALGALPVPTRLRALHETARIAMRMVILSETSQGVAESEARDWLVETPTCDGSVEHTGNRLLLNLSNRLRDSKSRLS